MILYLICNYNAKINFYYISALLGTPIVITYLKDKKAQSGIFLFIIKIVFISGGARPLTIH